MENVSAVKVISPIYGLEEGDVLSRAKKEDNFKFLSEHVGEEFSFSSMLELSQDMVSGEAFTPISFFKTKKEFIKNLKQENEELKSENEELENQLKDATGKLNDLNRKIKENLESFESKYDKIARDYFQEYLTEEEEKDVNISMTALSNMITLLNRLSK